MSLWSASDSFWRSEIIFCLSYQGKQFLRKLFWQSSAVLGQQRPPGLGTYKKCTFFAPPRPLESETFGDSLPLLCYKASKDSHHMQGLRCPGLRMSFQVASALGNNPEKEDDFAILGSSLF